MRWSERQVVMLREMGVRLWEPQPDPFGADDSTPRPPAGREAGAAVMTAAVPVTANATSVVLGAVTGMGWDELREAVVGCTACGLCKGRRQAVFGVGNQRADWMIVGEAPGEQEDIQGEPFVGKSGQLLDNMLRAIGLGRADLPGDDAEAAAARQVYIANTIKCRPPGNRNPEPEEVARCTPFLKQQIALIGPKLIIAMGRFAAQTLLASDASISSLRGRVYRYEGVPLIVTYHPAYLLRNLPDKAKAWADLVFAKKTMGSL